MKEDILIRGQNMKFKDNILNTKLKIENVEFLFLLLYFAAMSAHQLGQGFDAVFVRVIFVVLIIGVFVINKKFVISDVFKWSVVFWGFYMLSCLWSKNVNDTLYYKNNMIQIVAICLLLPTIIKSKEDFLKVLKLLLFSLVYTSILIILRTPISDWGTGRIGTVVGMNPNFLGFRLAIGAMIALFFTYKNRKENNRIGIIKYLILFIIISILVLFSGSKRALIILGVGFTCMELFNSKGRKLIFKVITILCIGITVALSMFYNNKLYTTIGKRVEKFVWTIVKGDAVNISDKDTSLVERTFYVDEAIKLFVENPILGCGGNNFRTKMREISYKHVSYSHNNFVELLSTLGIIGFLIYYAFVVKTIIKLFINTNKAGDELIATLLFILMILISISDFATVSYVDEFNIIILCLASIYINIAGKEKMKLICGR